jgi:hypothetical protein
MPSLGLDFYGASIRLTSDSARLIDELARDFDYFRAEGPSRPGEIELEFRARAPEPAGPRRPWLRAPKYRVSGWRGRRTIEYADGPVAEFDPVTQKVGLSCADADRLHELAYLAVLSRAGEALDRRGLHRAHALGFALRGQGGLVLLPSGGGKSTLALALARRRLAEFLSEDTPLVSADGRLSPFPVRWALRPDADLSGVPAGFIRSFIRKLHGPKKVVDVGFFRERISPPVPARWLIVGEPSRGRPSLEPASALRVAPALFVGLVAGWGVPQMAEYMLRPGAGLSGIAWRRAAAARTLLRSARCLRLRLGSSPDEAAALLEGLSR